MTADLVLLRRDALNAAIAATRRDGEDWPEPEPVLAVADRFYAWLRRPMSLTLTFGWTVSRKTGEPFVIRPNYSVYSHRGDPRMSNLQLGDTQQVTATATALDADKQPTTDTLTWAASPASAVSLTPAADTMSCVIAGLVPTANVVVTATDSLGNTTSGEIDVIAGPAASLSLQFGAVTDQPSTGSSSTAASSAGTAAADSGGTATATTGTGAASA